jgi:hypothetical protein
MLDQAAGANVHVALDAYMNAVQLKGQWAQQL